MSKPTRLRARACSRSYAKRGEMERDSAVAALARRGLACYLHLKTWLLGSRRTTRAGRIRCQDGDAGRRRELVEDHHHNWQCAQHGGEYTGRAARNGDTQCRAMHARGCHWRPAHVMSETIRSCRPTTSPSMPITSVMRVTLRRREACHEHVDRADHHLPDRLQHANSSRGPAVARNP